MVELRRDGVDARPEIMVPLPSLAAEFAHQKEVIDKVKADVITVRSSHGSNQCRA